MANRTVARTCNPISVHEYSWTVENVSRIPEKLSGPNFSPFPRREEIIRFELSSVEYDKQISVYVKLIIFFKSFTFNLICDLTICNATGKILATHRIKSLTVKEYYGQRVTFFDLVRKPGELELLDLPEDKLILKAKFSFSAYDTAAVSTYCAPTITNPPLCHVELSKDLKSMLENGVAHDVTFSLGGKTIPAHTAILCCRSPVFAKMFQHDMLEKRSKSVVIKDIDLETFHIFLRFLYSGEVEEKDWKAVVKLYSVADTYEVMSLRRECSQILAEKLSIASVSIVLQLADLHCDAELKEASKIYLRSNFTQVVQTSDWAKPSMAQTC